MSFGYYCLNRPFTKPLNGAKAINNFSAVIYRKVELTDIYVRRHYFETHCMTFIDVHHNLIRVLHIGGQDGRHEKLRIVCFEPGRLIGDQRIGSGVRLIKTIAGEFFHEIKN